MKIHFQRLIDVQSNIETIGIGQKQSTKSLTIIDGDFSKKIQHLVEKYYERKVADVLQSEVLEDFSNEIIDLYYAMKKEKESPSVSSQIIF